MKAKTESLYLIERHATLAQLDGLEKDWMDLVNEIPDIPIYLTFEWIRTWWLYFGKDRQLWLLTARDAQGRLLGIAPWMRELYKRGFLKLGMIAFIGTGRVCPTNLNILARGSHMEPVYRAFLDFVFAHHDQWDVLRIASVRQDSNEHRLLRAAGGRVRIGAETKYLSVHLPGSWESYLKTAKRDHRYDITSARARLGSDFPGLFRFACVTDARDLDGAIGRLVELVRLRHHDKKAATDWDDATFTSFHRAIASTALNRGWLRLYTLTVKDQMIAVFYNFRFKDSIYGYSIAFDSKWSRYSPGRLIMAFGIETAIQEGASEVEFGRKGNAYKSDWANRERVENEILFSSSWRGDLWIRIGNLERAVRIRASQWLVRRPKCARKQLRSYSLWSGRRSQH